MVIWFFGLLVGGLTLASPRPAATQEKWTGACSIQFLGKSTLHDFTGKVTADPFTLTVIQPEARDKATLDTVITVSVAKIDTDEEKRDEKMRETLEAARHPLISVTLDKVKVADTLPQWRGRLPVATVLPFDLTIMGATKEITGKFTSWEEKDGVVTMIVVFPVSLKAYDIEVPTVLGFIKVKDTIEVEAVITLKPES